MGLSLPHEQALNDDVTLSDGKQACKGLETDVVYITPEYFSVLQNATAGGSLFYCC